MDRERIGFRARWPPTIRLSHNTVVASAKPAARKRLLRLISESGATKVTEEEAARLSAALPDVKPRRLRQLLRETGLELAPVVEGVRQNSFADLERTLRALGEEYEQAAHARRRAIRTLVLEAKDHARLAVRNPRISPEARSEREEMIRWMLTWLENPPVFSAWVDARKRARNSVAGGTPEPEQLQEGDVEV